jgi:signal peptidase I
VAAVLGAAAALTVAQFVVTPRYMPSGGMEPTVPIAGRYLVDRVSFRVTGLSYGDVMEFPMPGEPDWLAVKRVIGLPGDRVECRDGRVHRNGAALDEPYLPADATERRTDCAPVTVPAGMLFVLGDHRLASADSREWGPAAQADVDGRLLVAY